MSHPRDDKIVSLHGVWGSAPDNFFAVGEPLIEADGITKHGTILALLWSLRNLNQPLLIYGNPVQQGRGA